MIEGRVITISYEGTVLKVFKKKDLEAQKYIKRLNEDKTFLKGELKLARKSAYGITGISKKAIEFRKTLPNPKHSGNIAIFEYLDKNNKLQVKEFTTMSTEELLNKGLSESPHAEILGMKWIKKQGIPNKNVKRVYSELEPWKKETYVFNEIWSQKRKWTTEELQHALRYVNRVRKKAGQSLLDKKL